MPTYRSFVKRFEENAAVGSAALTAVQGRHSLPSPFKSLFFTANKTKNSPMAVFALFGCGGSGARRNDRTVVNKVPFGTLEPYGDRARRREGFEPHVLAFSLRRKCCGQFGGSDLPPAGHSLPPHPPSYSPFGLITLSLRVHTLSQAKQKTARWLFLLCLVAEVGFEPHVLAFSLRRKCCGQFGGSDLPPAGHSLPPHPPSYSPFGLITLSLRVHTLSQAKQKTARWLFLLCLVAEVGFEPHDLRVMSPTSYRTALLRDTIGAGSRGRTGTRGEPHGILSPGRLPIPPFRHVFRCLPDYDITKDSVCQ